MNDMNRLLIFLLLSGLLYALYKYQHLIFGQFTDPSITDGNYQRSKKQQVVANKQLKYNKQSDSTRDGEQITVDNISQISMKSLENEKGSPHKVYKQDSILGSLGCDSETNNSNNSNMSDDVNSLFDDMSKDSRNTQDSAMTQNSKDSKDSLFF